MTAETVSMEWDLRDLFASHDDPQITATLDQAERDATAFDQTYRGTIDIAGGPTTQHLRNGLVALEQIYDKLNRTVIYTGLLFNADTSKTEYRSVKQAAEERTTQIANQLVFFDLELLSIEDAVAERLINDPALEPYCDYLRRTRRLRPYKLSEAEEKIVNEKDMTGKRAWQTLFSEITSTLRFRLREEDGSEKDGTLSEALARFHNPNREQRQQGFEALYATLGENKDLLASIYNNILQDHLTEGRLRGYPEHVIERRNIEDMLPTDVIATMLDVVEQNTTIAQDYFRLKAQLLQIPRMQIYDQYAPLNLKESREIAYSEARQIVLQSLERFDPEVAQIAQRFFDQNWIDAALRPGKRGGAFCSSVTPSLHPYILCNYTGTTRDVSTIAHELGHGLHAVKAAKQSLLNFYSPMPMAEIASIFFEMIVFEDMIAQESDPAVAFAMLCTKIEDSFATIFRQMVLTRFEQAAFVGRAQQRLTVEDISQHWLSANARYYGDAIEQTPGYELGWSYIPHFINTPFYCYSYVFGELIVHALYALYRKEGKSFIPRYLQLLESGGSREPIALLNAVGVDIRDPAFWQHGIDQLKQLIERARALAPKPQ